MTEFFQSPQFTFVCAGTLITFFVLWLSIKVYQVNHDVDQQRKLKQMDKGREE